MISRIEIVLIYILILTTKKIMMLRSNLNTNSNLTYYSGSILLHLIIADVVIPITKLWIVPLKNLQIHISNYTIVLNLLPIDLLVNLTIVQIIILQIHNQTNSNQVHMLTF